MNEAEKSRFRDEVDAFISASKRLSGPPPHWGKEARPHEVGIRWPVEESDGVNDRSHLAFLYRTESPMDKSVTLVYRMRQVCRVDLKPRDHREINPHHPRSMGLPRSVSGSHIHEWKHNREYVLELPPGVWKLPMKVEISSKARTYKHILPCICNACGIDFTPEQSGIAPPTKEELNELLS